MRLGLLAAAFGLALAGCASAETAANDPSYPSLRDVPTGTDANTDPAHWAELEAELLAAREALQSHPRAAPASATESPAEFLDEAREDIEEARQSHEPN
ncbi:MAG TPA: hypothetical protein VEA80_00400 [Vitreimonas sp.]|uniref:hypothetical protein n=1 Tax=Vitreimonas sp. TaxID=3069702 RepID=UPI002D6AF73B|nr:hypothetical protein [Vitreimonas sp.]HYD85910.1 hypothetical protein [Vitreimonas sp.]